MELKKLFSISETSNKSTKNKIPRMVKKTQEEKNIESHKKGLYSFNAIFDNVSLPKSPDRYGYLLDKMYSEAYKNIIDKKTQHPFWSDKKIDKSAATTQYRQLKYDFEKLRSSIRLFKKHETADIYFYYGSNSTERKMFLNVLGKHIKDIYAKINETIEYLDINYNENVKKLDNCITTMTDEKLDLYKNSVSDVNKALKNKIW